MNDQTDQTRDQAEAFQKIWMESMSKLMQTAFTFGPDSAPPEIMRQIRSGILQALAASWEEFMRSPQFLEGMRQWMESAVGFRQFTNDFMAKARNEVQAPSREDMDSIMLSVRHIEKRLLDRMDELSQQIKGLPAKGKGRSDARPAPVRRARRRRSAK